MPWNEMTTMDARMAFVLEHARGMVSLSELCRIFSISRPTGYKWIERYHRDGAHGLLDRSSAPLEHGRRIDAALEDLIVDLKTGHPSWGPKKIRVLVGMRRGLEGLPSASTVGLVLKRHGLVKPRRFKRHVPPTPGGLTGAFGPNHVWAADHKGWVKLRTGERLEPLTITDQHSRYLIGLSASGSTRHDEVMPLFRRAFFEHGLPDIIRTDNGAPFASAGVTGLTRLSLEWARLGILHERIAPGKPQQNGRHERFHLTLKEVMASPIKDRAAARAIFERFRADYNEKRPHEALGQTTPASHYRPSPRPLPSVIRPPEYPDDAMVKRVRTNGEIKWRGKMVYVADILAGEPIAITEDDDGLMTIAFYKTPIGRIKPDGDKLMPFRRDRHATENQNCKQPNRSEV